MPDYLESAHHDLSFIWSEASELSAYRKMLQIRRFEEKAAQLYAMGQIPVLAPLSIGQEAVAVGLALAAGTDDELIAGPRPHGLILARGIAPDPLMASLLANGGGADTPQSGMGLTAELMSELHAKHVQVPSMATGPAPTHVQNLAQIATSCRDGRAVVWCIGDGARDETEFFDIIVRASAQKMPVVFVIENTSSGVPGIGVCTAAPLALPQRCSAAGVETVSVNGLDVRHVKAAADHALEGARQGRGAAVLDIMTYRYRGHATGIGARTERPREDTDPIAKARARMVLDGGARVEARIKEIEQSVRTEVSVAFNLARAGSTAA